MTLMLHKCHTSILIYNFVMSVMISCEQTYDNFLGKVSLKKAQNYTNKYLQKLLMMNKTYMNNRGCGWVGYIHIYIFTNIKEKVEGISNRWLGSRHSAQFEESFRLRVQYLRYSMQFLRVVSSELNSFATQC